MAHILVVEDDSTLARLIQDILEEEGYTVTVVTRSMQALDTLRVIQPDLILLDVLLDALTGIDLCEAITGHPATAHIPIILCSAVAKSWVPVTCPYRAFLAKPFAVQRLLEVVAIHVRRA